MLIILSAVLFPLSKKNMIASGSQGVLARGKSPDGFEEYQERLRRAGELNAKLKELAERMRSNAVARKNGAEDGLEEGEVGRQRKKAAKLSGDIQQQTKNLNVLTSENGRLKGEVECSRNSRVIYSNVYKTIEKEIRRHEYLYKLAIVDHLAYREVQNRLIEKTNTLARRLEKDIAHLVGPRLPSHRMHNKSRLDTGLTSLRQSKDRCRDSEAGSKVTRLETLREAHSACKEEVVVAEVSRPRARLMTEQFNDYYQLEMKSNYYDNVIRRLKEASGLDNLTEITEVWDHLDAMLEEHYAEYLKLQENIKHLTETQEEMENSQWTEAEIGGIQSAEEQELQQLETECGVERELVKQQEEKLTQLMDINCHRLSDQEIHHHILRIKRRGEATTRELEKLLEGAEKQRRAGATPTVSRVVTQTH